MSTTTNTTPLNDPNYVGGNQELTQYIPNFDSNSYISEIKQTDGKLLDKGNNLMDKLRALRENPINSEKLKDPGAPFLPASEITQEQKIRGLVNEQFTPLVPQLINGSQGGINPEIPQDQLLVPQVQPIPEKKEFQNVVPKTEKTEVIGEKLDTKPEQVQEKPVKNQLFSLLAPLIKEWQKNFMPAGQEIKEAEKPNFEKVIKLIRSNRDSYSEIEKAAVSLINKEHKNN